MSGQRQASNNSSILNVDGDVVAKTESTTHVDSIDADAASDKYIGNNLARSEPMAGDLDNVRLYERIIIET